MKECCNALNGQISNQRLNQNHWQKYTGEDTKNILISGVGGQGVLLAALCLGKAALAEGFSVRTAETHGMAQRGGSVSVHVRFGKNVKSPLIPPMSADVFLALEPAEAVRNFHFINSHTLVLINSRPYIPSTVTVGKKIKVDKNKCIGCGNCVQSCYVNYYFNFSKNSYILNLASTIKDSRHISEDNCTGCGVCLDSCPTDALELNSLYSYPEQEEIKKLFLNNSKSVIKDYSELAISAGNIKSTNIVMLGKLAEILEKNPNILPIRGETLFSVMKESVPRKNLEANIKAFCLGKA